MFLPVWVWCRRVETPKSATLIFPSLLTRMFAALISLCIILLACRYAKPFKIYAMIIRICLSPNPLFFLLIISAKEPASQKSIMIQTSSSTTSTEWHFTMFWCWVDMRIRIYFSIFGRASESASEGMTLTAYILLVGKETALYI